MDRSTYTLKLGSPIVMTVVAAGLGGLGGCRSYEPRAIDLAGHQAAFLARTPESPEVARFAAEIAGAQAAGGAFDPTDGVDAREAEAMALVFNGDLRVARLKAGVTRAGAENAGLWEDPTIGVDLTRIVQSTPHPWKAGVSVGLTIPISGRLEVEKKKAGQEHAAELARIALAEWSVRMEVRRAWVRWEALDAELRTTREFLDRMEQTVNIVDTMERAGEMARTEARLFRIEQANKRADLAGLQSRALEAELAMRQLMGMSPSAAMEMVSAGVGGEVIGSRDVVAFRAGLTERSPMVGVARAEYEVAERTLELEVRKQYPDLQIGPGYGREDGMDQVLLGLSVPIPLLNGNRRGIAEGVAAREAAGAHVEATLERAIGELALAEALWRSAAERRRMLEEEIVPLVDAQYADARRVAQLGEINTLVLLESLSRQQEAKVRLIEARRDEAMAVIRIDEVAGPEVEAKVETGERP